jgi:hypothetical protein
LCSGWPRDSFRKRETTFRIEEWGGVEGVEGEGRKRGPPAGTLTDDAGMLAGITTAFEVHLLNCRAGRRLQDLDVLRRDTGMCRDEVGVIRQAKPVLLLLM